MADTETSRTAVQSPIADLMTHFEFAAFAEGTDPAAVGRICNRMLFGHPAGPAAYEEGGPRRYEPRAFAEIDAVLRQLASRDGLNALDVAAIRRVRHLLYGGHPPDDGPASRNGST
jgi:hypothetical protein